MRNNMAYVRISYGQLSYESLDEEIAYSLFDLIGEYIVSENVNISKTYL